LITLVDGKSNGKVNDCLTKEPPGEHVAIRQRAPITARWMVDVLATCRPRSFRRSGILRVADNSLRAAVGGRKRVSED